MLKMLIRSLCAIALLVLWQVWGAQFYSNGVKAFASILNTEGPYQGAKTVRVGQEEAEPDPLLLRVMAALAQSVAGAPEDPEGPVIRRGAEGGTGSGIRKSTGNSVQIEVPIILLPTTMNGIENPL